MENSFLSTLNSLLRSEGREVRAYSAANPENILALERFLHRGLPSPLKSFYETLGGLGMVSTSDEPDDVDPELEVGGERPGCYGPTVIPSPALLLHELRATARYMRLDSMGIIDWLRYQWDNDRPEFEEEPPELLAQLNKQYTGFGFRRFGQNSARHIYMDDQGRCGFVDYHQDNYSDLWDVHLHRMLKESPANLQLEDALKILLTNRKAPAAY